MTDCKILSNRNNFDVCDKENIVDCYFSEKSLQMLGMCAGDVQIKLKDFDIQRKENGMQMVVKEICQILFIFPEGYNGCCHIDGPI